MVKKSSFLEKLKNRLRHSDLQVETPDRTAADRVAADRVAADRAAPVRPELRGARPVAPERARIEPMPAVREPEVVSGRKMTQREEAAVAIQDGFKELTSLLRGMQNRVEDQGERFAQAADGLAQLPALQQAQIDMLQSLADRLDQQNRQSQVVVQTLGDLPQLMGHVREALDRAASTDERTARTLGEFRSNMDRIQGSMERMVDHSRQHAESAQALAHGREEQARELAEQLSTQHQSVTREAVARLEATQRESVRSLRDAQADQAGRLGKIMEEGAKTNRAVLILLGLVFVALVAIALVLASR